MPSEIRVTDTPRCPVCQGTGPVLHERAKDYLFGTPGEWRYRRCASCRLVWQDPMVAEADISRLYDSYYTHARPEEGSGTAVRGLYRAAQAGHVANRYGYPARWTDRVLGRLLALHPGRRIDAEYRAQFLPASARGPLLDVGCGHGATLADMHRLGWQVHGVDPDPAAVEAARSRGFPVTLGTVFSPELPPDSFKAITMSQVIEHVHRPIEMLRRCRDLLQPGGMFVAMTPNADSRAHRAFGRAWRGLEPPRHLQVFSRGALEMAARQAGFESVCVTATIRSVRGIYDASLAIQQAASQGADRSNIPAPTVTSELWQLVVWLQTFVRPDAGDELVLVARRTRDA
jgi:SAM-dependent methyltransferase